MSILDIINKDKLKEILTQDNFEIIKKIYNEKTNEQKLEEVKKEIKSVEVKLQRLLDGYLDQVIEQEIRINPFTVGTNCGQACLTNLICVLFITSG